MAMPNDSCIYYFTDILEFFQKKKEMKIIVFKLLSLLFRKTIEYGDTKLWMSSADCPPPPPPQQQ